MDRADWTRIADRAALVAAAAIAASIVVAGWHDVSYGYDIWYYHLPFAARLVGLIDASTYQLSADNAARLAGFPLLGELAQGIAWRLTGRVEATSLVSIAALLAVPLALRRLAAVPLHVSLLALLAIPLVQIHATSSYVDLPANACVTILCLALWRAIADAPTPRLVAAALVAGAAAANTKFQLVPIVGVALAALLVVVLLARRRAPPDVRRRLGGAALAFVVAAPVVLATPIKNAIVHGSPVWPVELVVLGRSLPHREKAYAQSPPHLSDAPRPVRFARSVLEVDNRPLASHRRWSLDQWAPPDDPACRMGGYFGAYVVVNLVALAVAIRRRTRASIAAGAVLGGVTLVAALVPQSHELRYYMHWMMLLVALNCALWASERRLACLAVAATALGIVAWSTGGGYLYASGKSFAAFRAENVDRSVIERAAPGERLCIAREPFTFLYAPLFDVRKDYRVTEATRDDCAAP